ncbi:hypothetical protein QWZ10_20185 [Paracoccus cavernae]|uniref:Uncharacterized protein n=1 Tax=Paracoccus cavernae TaxID=1571207 RepID=A0ABT8DAW9_9RHOB|nr:hypothetical protein [Paracoccus cavernae]
MRFVSYEDGGRNGIAVATDGAANGPWKGLREGNVGWPGTLQSLIETGGDALAKAGKALASAPEIDLARMRLLPPLSHPEKLSASG